MKLLWPLLSVIGASLVISASPRSTHLIRYEDSRYSMGCAYTVVAYGRDARAVRQSVNAAFDEVDRLDRLMSHYKPDSPLSRLNREGARGPVRVEPELFNFIEECLRYSRASEGAFDITVGPLMKAWGFFRGEGRLPGEAELSALRRQLGYQHVLLDRAARTVRFDRPGMELDLGGIAKGYAVDRAVRLLKDRHIEAALINAGGSTLYGMGTPPEGLGWEVKMQDPLDSQKTALTVRLKDQALSVSGGDEKFFEIGGVRYSHIMDPRTGRPGQNMLSVAVLTGSGTAGDALDNVFYVLGIEKSRGLLESLPPTEIFFFLPEAGKGWKMVRLKN